MSLCWRVVPLERLWTVGPLISRDLSHEEAAPFCLILPQVMVLNFVSHLIEARKRSTSFSSSMTFNSRWTTASANSSSASVFS
jgi:hypothetical protein